MATMKVLEILERGQEILAGLPDRNLTDKTAKLYRATHDRMRRQGRMDPLEGSRTRDTYGVRRAALHYGACLTLRGLVTALERAGASHDVDEIHASAHALQHYTELVADPLQRHPPQDEIDFSLRSPWQEKDEKPRRGAGSKKFILPSLPPGWREKLWLALPETSRYRTVIATMCLCPARPGEYVFGIRDEQYAPGVQVLRRGDELLIYTVPLKSHGGQYGTEIAGVKVSIAQGGAPARHLADLCDETGGSIEVMADGADALRKAVGRAAASAGLPKGITPNCFRAQWMADAKSTLGSGEAVAAGAGHISVKSQSRYGRAEHGRKGGSGLVGTFSKRQPRPLTAERQARFSRLKEHAHQLRTAGAKGIVGGDISGSSVRSAVARSEPLKFRLDRLPKAADFGGSAPAGSKFHDAAPLAKRSREGEPMGELTTPYPAAGRF